MSPPLDPTPDPDPAPPPTGLWREHRWWLLTALALVLLGAFHRTRLNAALLASPAPPLSFDPNGIGLVYLARYGRDDLLIAGLFVLAYGLLRALILHDHIRRSAFGRCVARIEPAVLILILCVASFLHVAHFRVVFELNSGLDIDVLLAGAEDMTLSFAKAYITTTTVVLLSLPILLLPLLVALSSRFPKTLAWSAGLLLIATGALALQPERFRPVEALRNGPIHYVLTGLKRLEAGNPFTRDRSLPPADQLQTLALRTWDGDAGRPPQPGALRVQLPATPLNVILMVIEGTAFDYIFHGKNSGGEPLDAAPFLRGLATRGWSFENHFATANHSSRAVFSMLTGLYPPPQNRVYCTRNDIAIPIVYDLLDEAYTCFFTTPAKTTFAFPTTLLHKCARVQVDDFYDLCEPATDDAWIARSEHLAVDRFLERLDAAEPPFFGSYVSFLPHLPNDNPEAEDGVVPGATASIDRYYNNLHYVDGQLRRIFERVCARGLLDDTVFLVVGDHGEAFGQHEGNKGHSQQSYRENFHVPCVLFGPRVFSPARYEAPTSHVDLFSTLLALMGAQPHPGLSQGRSLLHEPESPRLVFFYGREFTLSALAPDLRLVQVSYKRGEAWAYDLKTDRDQRHRLPVTERDQDLSRAILQFRNYQNRIVPAYDEACRAGLPFFGMSHPR